MSEELGIEMGDTQDSAPVESQASEPVDTMSAAPDVQHQPAPQPQQQPVWAAFKSLPDFQNADDREIAQRLYQSFEREKAATKSLAQYQQLIPYAQEYLKHREPFEEWMSQRNNPQPVQAAPQQAPEPKAAGWWNPPDIKDSDKSFLRRDENGREVVAEDAPIHVRERLYEYQRYKAEFAQKFLANPEEALGPMVEQIAQRKADEMIGERLTAQQEQAYVSQIDQDNRDWLYDQQGNPTREGLAIQKYIGDASDMGITSPQKKWDYATSMLERDLLNSLRERQASSASQQAFAQAMPQQQIEPPAQPDMNTNQAQKDIEYLRREASRRPSRSTRAPDPRAPRQPMTFEERLKAQLARDGLV